MTDTNHRYCTLGSSVNPSVFEVDGIDALGCFGDGNGLFLKSPVVQRSSLKGDDDLICG